MTLFWIISGVILAILLLLLVLGYAAYRIAFKYRGAPDGDPFDTLSRHPEFEKRRREYIEKTLSLPYEAVRIKSRDCECQKSSHKLNASQSSLIIV